MNLKYILIVVLLLMFVAGCSGHDRRDRYDHPQPAKQELLTPYQKLYKLKGLLELSDAQVQELKPVFVDEYSQLKKLEDDDPDHEELENRKSDIDWEVYKKLNKILSEKQMYKYLKFIEEQKVYTPEPRESKGSGGRRGGPPRGGMF